MHPQPLFHRRPNSQGFGEDRTGLRFVACNGIVDFVTAIFTVDDNGQIILPEALKRIFDAEPGARLRAEVTSDRIEIVKELPVAVETTRSSSGRLVLAPTGVSVDTARAIRESRDELASRALRK